MHKCAGLPASGRNRLDKSLTTKRPAAKSSQIRFETRFIEKYETFRIYVRLTREPVSAFDGDVFTILFGCSL